VLLRRADDDDDECSMVTDNDPQMAELKAVSVAARELTEGKPHPGGAGRSSGGAAPGSMTAPPKSHRGDHASKSKGRASTGGAGGSSRGATPAAPLRGKGGSAGAGTSAGASAGEGRYTIT
jgi:hypothetical protein